MKTIAFKHTNVLRSITDKTIVEVVTVQSVVVGPKLADKYFTNDKITVIAQHVAVGPKLILAQHTC